MRLASRCCKINNILWNKNQHRESSWVGVLNVKNGAQWCICSNPYAIIEHAVKLQWQIKSIIHSFIHSLTLTISCFMWFKLRGLPLCSFSLWTINWEILSYVVDQKYSQLMEILHHSFSFLNQNMCNTGNGYKK